MISAGNASAPRWFGGDIRNLDAYIERIASFGATSTELVLHHGPADERNARVHIQQHDWQPVAGRFRAHGLNCHLHASLAPAFSLRRWLLERRRVQMQYRPLLRFGEQLCDSSVSPVVLVLHAANALEHPAEVNARATDEFLAWAMEESSALGGNLRFAIELRHEADRSVTRFDTDRELLRRFVEQYDQQRIGVCWDIGNDLQQFQRTGETPQPPGAAFLRSVIHVHVHGQGPGGDMHYPLLSEQDWAVQWLGLLPAAGYAGAVTLEIRHRLAASRGEPLTVLGRSYRLALNALGANVESGGSQA